MNRPDKSTQFIIYYNNGDGSKDTDVIANIEWRNQLGELHNSSGPAKLLHKTDGTEFRKLWCIHGVAFSFNDWCKKTNNCPTLMMMMYT